MSYCFPDTAQPELNGGADSRADSPVQQETPSSACLVWMKLITLSDERFQGARPQTLATFRSRENYVTLG